MTTIKSVHGITYIATQVKPRGGVRENTIREIRLVECILGEWTGIDNPCRKKLNAFWRATGVIGKTFDNVVEAVIVKVNVKRIVSSPIDSEWLDEVPGNSYRDVFEAIHFRQLLSKVR
jgi:hypothetical protein